MECFKLLLTTPPRSKTEPRAPNYISPGMLLHSALGPLIWFFAEPYRTNFGQSLVASPILGAIVPPLYPTPMSRFWRPGAQKRICDSQSQCLDPGEKDSPTQDNIHVNRHVQRFANCMASLLGLGRMGSGMEKNMEHATGTGIIQPEPPLQFRSPDPPSLGHTLDHTGMFLK